MTTSEFRYCDCKHLEAVHYAQNIPTFTPNYGQPKVGLIGTRFESYRCHYVDCKCRRFHWDRSLWSKIKRQLGGK